jgi:hypothetical protein
MGNAPRCRVLVIAVSGMENFSDGFGAVAPSASLRPLIQPSTAVLLTLLKSDCFGGSAVAAAIIILSVVLLVR